MTPIQKATASAILKHGGVRKASSVMKISPGYLTRLANGEKDSPGAVVLAKLGLQKVVTYVPVGAQGPSSSAQRVSDEEVAAALRDHHLLHTRLSERDMRKTLENFLAARNAAVAAAAEPAVLIGPPELAAASGLNILKFNKRNTTTND